MQNQSELPAQTAASLPSTELWYVPTVTDLSDNWTHPSLNSWTESQSHSSKGATNILLFSTTSHFSLRLNRQETACSRWRRPKSGDYLHPWGFTKVSNVNVQFPIDQNLPDSQLGHVRKHPPPRSAHLTHLHFAADAQYVIAAGVIFHHAIERTTTPA